jgi:hypothetical protein
VGALEGARRKHVRKVGQYLSFQKLFLIAIVVVFLVRLGLSLAGTPIPTAKWISVTVILLLGTLYYGVAVHTRGFGSYKQLYPLGLFQSLLAEGLVGVAIILGILTGQDNIYTAPEFSGGVDSKNWGHVLGHVAVGIVLLPLMSWAISSIVLFVTKKVAPRSA